MGMQTKSRQHMTRGRIGVLVSALAAIFALSLLGACGGGKFVKAERSVYKAKLSTQRGDRRAFTVTVTPASAGLEGALAAGRDKAIEYCMRNWGGSKIAWEIGPDTPVDAITVADDRVVLSGACAIR